jgi:hypothetical protein
MKPASFRTEKIEHYTRIKELADLELVTYMEYFPLF